MLFGNRGARCEVTMTVTRRATLSLNLTITVMVMVIIDASDDVNHVRLVAGSGPEKT